MVITVKEALSSISEEFTILTTFFSQTIEYTQINQTSEKKPKVFIQNGSTLTYETTQYKMRGGQEKGLIMTN